MKTCSICGNEIELNAAICPYCNSEQDVVSIDKKKIVKRVRVFKVKEGNPTVAEAIERLDIELSIGNKNGIKVLKIIHGYGSTGIGGAIKVALLKRLKLLQNQGDIQSIITGEEHNQYGASRSRLLKTYPELQETWNQDRGNAGITFVEL